MDAKYFFFMLQKPSVQKGIHLLKGCQPLRRLQMLFQWCQVMGQETGQVPQAAEGKLALTKGSVVTLTVLFSVMNE